MLLYQNARSVQAGGWCETYIKVAGQWKYLYRAVDKSGDTVDFLLTVRRDFAAARRYLAKRVHPPKIGHFVKLA